MAAHITPKISLWVVHIVVVAVEQVLKPEQNRLVQMIGGSHIPFAVCFMEVTAVWKNTARN
ncbi:hypothetical protein CCACVL1_29142 [Corchorus capsularis]|uniref:Uncharacterized protein n=1 Tax=Corchorus capsularis TaxID=210143 RepID=A0A1R3G3M0_COCAP|nr:hypothetical protein CCACVL1_29142 [Corchorus capsularis]